MFREKYKYLGSCDFNHTLKMVRQIMERESIDNTYSDLYSSEQIGEPDLYRGRLSGRGSVKPDSRRDSQPNLIFNLGKLQIAGILLIIVFLWGVLSAVAISMSEIDPPATIEFEDDGKGDVSGHVYDENGINLENVTVAIHGTQHFTRTNLEGFFSIEDIKEGDYEIEASLEGYGSETKRISIIAHKPLHLGFFLEEGGFGETSNERYGSELPKLRHLPYTTAIFILVYGSLALIGGILAYIQRFYWIAMFGSLCGTITGILSIGIIIASILSIIALVLIIGNQEEFTTSETSFIDRLFGARKAETRVKGAPRKGFQKLKPYGPQTKPESSTIEPSYEEEEYAPDTALPLGVEESMPQKDSEGIGEPPPTCDLCGGTVRTEAQGIRCQCGAWYHRFCASSISECKKCGAPI
jgi:hypothetical protein